MYFDGLGDQDEEIRLTIDCVINCSQYMYLLTDVCTLS